MSQTPRTDKVVDYTAPEKLHREALAMERELSAAIRERDELDKFGKRAFALLEKSGMDAIAIYANAKDNEETSLEIGIGVLIRERDAALARIAELEKDKARLDWLESSGHDLMTTNGKDIIEKEHKPIDLATEAQVASIKQLVDLLKIDDETVAKWHEKANAETFSEYSQEHADKTLKFLNSKLQTN